MRISIFHIAMVFTVAACAKAPQKPVPAERPKQTVTRPAPSINDTSAKQVADPKAAESIAKWVASGPGCITISKAKPTTLPLELMSGAVSCLKSGEDQQAAELWAFAMTRARYDATRISQAEDFHHNPRGLTTAHYLEMPIAMYYGPKKYRAVKTHMSEMLQELGTETCQSIMAAGPPKYEPDYIMGYNPKDAAAVKRNDRNATQRWEAYLKQWDRCTT